MKKILIPIALLAITTLNVYAQSRNLSGRVTGKNGEALIGAVITDKSSGMTTISDENGNFSMEVEGTGNVLIVSMDGFANQEVNAGNSSNLMISFDDSRQQLTDVVVTALGIERKKDNDLSSSTAINAKSVQQSGEAGVIQGMSGKTSGLQIIRNSGDPGAGAYIQIRGQNTVMGNSSPLIILDGVPVSNSSIGQDVDGVVQQSRMNDINPDDIASITVLKGAAAASVWGTGAANGVIIINTKKGFSKGKRVTVDFSNQVSIDQINREFVKQDKYGQGSNGKYVANAAGSWGDKIADRTGGADSVLVGDRRFVGDDGVTIYPLLKKNSKETFNTVNRNQVFRTGITWNKSIGVNYSGNFGSTYISFADWNQQGIFNGNSNYRRTTVRVNNESNLLDNLKLKINSTFARTTSDRIQQGSNLNGLYLGYLRTAPDYNNTTYKGTYYDASGTPYINSHRGYRKYLGESAPVYNNPGWTLNEQQNPNSVYRFIVNPELQWNIVNNLKLTARYGFDYYNDKRETFFPYNSAADFQPGSFSRSNITEIINDINVFLSSSHDINENINLEWIVGGNSQNFNYSVLSAGIKQFINPFVGNVRSFDNATKDNTSIGQYVENKGKYGFYGVLSTTIYKKLLAEITARYEKASTLKDFNFYPSVSLGYIAFDNNSHKYINFAKLRASYGQIGIEPQVYLNRSYFGAYDRQSSWGDALAASVYGNPFAQSSILGNPNLKRELVTEYELGGDFRFFNNKLGLGITYYNRTTKDAILELDLPASSGYSSTFANAATISNKGIEIDANYRIISTANFSWSLNANYSKNKNMVESLSGVKSVFLNGFTGTSSRVVEGKPFGAFWGVSFEKDANGKLILDADGFPQAGAAEEYIGDPNPKWRGGLGTTLNYKGFSFSAQFETMQGHKIWAGTEAVMYHFGIHPETANEITLTKDMKNYNGTVIPAGTVVRGNIKDFGAGDVLLDQSWYTTLGGGFGPVGEQFIKDGSWTKLREVTLKYTFGDVNLNVFKIKNLSLGITGRNLFTWSKFPYIDPELNLTGNSKGRGLDYFTNPGTRSYVFSLNFNL